MDVVLWLLFTQGLMGAFDTLYYHEWRARLPAGYPGTAPELKLHASRDFIYCIIFSTLPFFAWQGIWAAALSILLFLEIAITISDFIIEDKVRQSLGGVYAGERATHALMGIIYGAMLAHLIPILITWFHFPTGLTTISTPEILRWMMPAMALGLLLSGLRDLLCSIGIKAFSWPHHL
jgi:hypothetical protein